MKYTLSQAATATGKNKATVQRAIKSGKISASKNSYGAYEIDPSELHRIFPATTRRVAQHHINNNMQHSETSRETLHLKLELLEAERQRERDQMQSTIDDLRARLDKAEDRVAMLLPAPTKQSWLPWKRP
jgi:hypothetical protein